MTLRIVAIGGTVYPGSTTEMALRYAARPSIEAGAEVTVFGGEYLGALPHYRGTGHGETSGTELVEAVRSADGLIVAAPGYHGTISGLVKNALDYLEDLSKDERPYLHERPVGLIATAYGDQAAMGTLLTMRGIVHALRGWPTPLGVTLRTAEQLFSTDGECIDDRAREQLRLVGEQVISAAGKFAAGSNYA
ncbi:NADPH-dependent FMN reductase [Erythrobacter mangrovi]|uniref:NAD(P)H-dependent oxidoreductase n=1 Tax=Erythrobacter mangrovi TaxID=2739433 RepID=A0A7D3XX82_9SPHN|nr:NADPH-dependent FMN reductase [Erythrobacter mangrovi]QKG72336.1 NAD(P)H-dependent oxidoreductase [Erythrobacter mangrovi]